LLAGDRRAGKPLSCEGGRQLFQISEIVRQNIEALQLHIYVIADLNGIQ
jgi:hypothetical protein